MPAILRRERYRQLLDIERAAKNMARAAQISRGAAMHQLPQLIKAVNRAGGPWS